MNPLKSIRRSLRAIGQSRAVKQEIDEELRFHLERRAAENIAAGMTPAEAARAARKRFGNLQSIREEARTIRGASPGEGFFQDVRFGLRMLRKNPGFTLIAVLMLALGIGANTAIFSMVHGVLMRPLPYANSERLVFLRERNMDLGFSHFSVAPGTLLDWQAQNHVFDYLEAASTSGYNLTGMDKPERILGLRVTADYLPMLGARPELGRFFLPSEDAPGQNQVVVLSHAFWKSRFGGDKDIVGKRITLDGTSRTIIGVTDVPGAKSALFLPISFTENERTDRGGHWLTVLGRLKPGVSIEQARAEMDNIAQNLQRQYPEAKRGWTALVDPLLEIEVGQARAALLILFWTVGLVLFIACANVAGLLLARASGREREFAIRAALGAGRGRIVRQLLTESALLGVGAGVAGLLVAIGGLHLFRQFGSALPRLDDVKLDGTVLGFALVASLGTGIIFGLAPALQAARRDLNEPLKDGGHGSSGGRRRNVLRTGLVVAEIALSLVLVVNAGLIIKTFIRLTKEPVGFMPSHLLAGDVGLTKSKYPNEQAQVTFFNRVLDRLTGTPGVESASAVSVLPLSGGNCWLDISIPGRTMPETSGAYFQVSANYFRTMQIPVISGRGFTDQDRESSPAVVVVNRTFVRTFFPDADPLGKQLQITDSGPNPCEIVGVIEDVKNFNLDKKIPAEMYFPYRQRCWGNFSIVIRTTADPAASAGLLRDSVLAVDPDQPVDSIRTVEQLVEDSASGERAMTLLMGTFAGIALLLCATGIYGLVSYTVSQRTHEFGIRFSLGATAGDVLRLVLRQGLGLALVGLVLGLAGALATSRVLASQLDGVEARDPAVFALATGLLAVVVILALLIPARRASTVNPMTALRHE